jgi:hypothetical protein
MQKESMVDQTQRQTSFGAHNRQFTG